MKIKSFIILLLLFGLTISIFFTFKYLNSKKIQTKNNQLTENYYIKNYNCSFTYKIGSTIDAIYMNKNYNVAIPTDECKNLNNGKIKPNLYYDFENDKVFYKDYYFPIGYVKISYFLIFIIPLITFLVYRKELNNDYKTM